MKRGTVVGIDQDPSWSEHSEWGPDPIAYHWGQLLTVELPGLVEQIDAKPAVCVERYDRVTADEKYMVVGDYSFTLDLDMAVCRLSGPDDLDTLAASLKQAAEQLRAFISAEGVATVVTEVPGQARSSAADEGERGAAS